MNDTNSRDDSLDAAVARVYGGPLDDFIRRRDALSKELRGAGNKDGATVIRNLRKPSRAAWALDIAAIENTEAMDALVEAVHDTLAAQSGGGEVRAAMAQLRAAVRTFAAHAADVSAHAGHSLDAGALANEVLAVLADPQSFSLLRRGCLAETPDAGGLDFLTTLASAGALPPRRGSVDAAPTHLADASQLAAARAATEQAVLLVARARERAAATQAAFRDAETKVHMAEARIRDAEEAARIARAERDRAREAADADDAALRSAERALAERQQPAPPGGSRGAHE